MKDIIIATKNIHKVEEFKKMLEPFNFNVLSILDINENIEIIEDGLTFKDNAIIKAEYLSRLLNKVCISDDSGLEVVALNYEPGIYSARYLGEDVSFKDKCHSIIDRLKDEKNRDARYVCVIALASPSNETITFEGILNGTIADTMSGINGFGYDPIFKYNNNLTLAEISNEEKNKISHRAMALNKLMEYLSNEK